MKNNCKAINRVFTKNVILDLIKGENNEVFSYVVEQYVEAADEKRISELFQEIYSHLGKENRNEYYYMNTLINKLLSGIHSVNTTTALSQIRIGHSIADLVLINEEGQVIEIKSDLDNFERLGDQLLDYYKAFSKVSVLTSIRDYERIQKILSRFGDMGDAVGIYVLSDRNTIFGSYKREPMKFDDYLDHEHIFKLLRKKEFEKILILHFGKLPETRPVTHFDMCLDYFRKIPLKYAQELAFNELKSRKRITVNEFQSIQTELKSVIYFSDLAKELPNLQTVLNSRYGGR